VSDGARRIGPQHVQHVQHVRPSPAESSRARPSPGERTTQPVQHPDAWVDGLLAEAVNESVNSS